MQEDDDTRWETDLSTEMICQTSVGIEYGEVGSADVTHTELLMS